MPPSFLIPSSLDTEKSDQVIGVLSADSTTFRSGQANFIGGGLTNPPPPIRHHIIEQKLISDLNLLFKKDRHLELILIEA